MRKFWKKENGQSLITFALLFVSMVGIVGAVIDYGYPAIIGNKMQNACDAAVLASVRELPAESYQLEAVKDLAISYVEKNGFEEEETTVEITKGLTGKYTKIKVTINKPVAFTIGKLFGSDQADLSKTAAAELLPNTGMRGLVPASVVKETFDSQISSGDYSMTLKYGGGNGTNGSYGAMDLDGENGGGANDYRNRMKYGYDGLVSIGDIIPVESGNMSGPTKEAVQYRCNACTHYPDQGGCTPEHFDSNCPRIMYVPIVEYVGSNHKNAQVVGFAAFLVDSVSGNGNESIIDGTYLPEVKVDGEYDPSKQVNQYGTYTIQFTE